MAKADWLLVNPESGSGNKTVNVSSGTQHTGRTARTTVLTFKAAGVENVPVTVNQAGKPQYIDVADAASAAKAGQVVTISGKANSSKLTFSLGTGELAVVLPEKYTANSLETNNSGSIVGDPGASAEYPFSIAVTVPANESVDEISRQIIVTDESGKSDTCLLTQAAGDATLSVSKSTVELTYQGTTVSIDVSSNTNWTAE